MAKKESTVVRLETAGGSKADQVTVVDMVESELHCCQLEVVVVKYLWGD